MRPLLPNRSPQARTGLHIVQIGYDDSVFNGQAASDTIDRQLAYGRSLAKRIPDSRITILTLTKQAATARQTGNVRYLPLVFRHWWHIPGAVQRALLSLQAYDPIHLVATQTPHEDGLGALLFRRRTNVPVIAQIHYDLFDRRARRENLNRGLAGVIRYALTRRCLRSFNAIRTVSRRITGQISRRWPQAPVHVISVPVTMLNQPTAAPPPPPRGNRVLFVGRLVKQKRMDRWISVARLVADHLPNATFTIVGEGPLRPNLERQVSRLGLQERVHFAGALPYHELPGWYGKSKVFLLTSDYEGFGRVLVEANYHGVPAVASHVAGTEDIIVDGQTGFLVARHDVAAMANRVTWLLAHETERQTMGAAARELVVRNFAPDKMIQQWVGLWLSTAAQFPDPLSTLQLRRRPTWRRWLHHARSHYSLLRSLEYEAIAGTTFNGRTLDLGGGVRNTYLPLLRINGVYDTVNIDPQMQPTYLADLNRPLPIADATYDNVLSLNTFEHIANDALAMSEGLRVLKEGGQFLFVIPFLYKIHGSPADYHRHTADWWHECLRRQDIRPENFSIEPLVWDARSTGGELQNFRNRRWRKALAMLPGVIEHRLRRAPRRSDHAVEEFALGYCIRGVKTATRNDGEPRPPPQTAA